MKSRKIKQNRPEKRGFIPAILIVILLIVFSGVLLREGRLRDMDVARLGSLEAAAAVAEAFSIGADPDTAGEDGSRAERGILSPAVSGWGVYTPEGVALAARGSAPPSLEAPSFSSSVNEEQKDNTLRTVRFMMSARPTESSPRRTAGGGAGMRRLILIDWNLKTGTNSEKLRLLGVSGLITLTILMLFIQLRASRRLADYRRDEERRRRLMQLGMAARTLTHEIRNPLGTIRGQTALLKKTLPSEAADGLNTINGEVDRLNALSGRVQEWLSDPRGRPDVFPAGSRIHSLLDNKEWNLVIETSSPGPRIRMDPALFDSAVMNLVRNAVESGGESEGAIPDVPEIVTTVTGRSLYIDVKDRGCGFPEEDHENLFDPFFTTKTRGSGVGLAFSRQVVEAAGGKLKLENRPGGGTHARISLPLEGK